MCNYTTPCETCGLCKMARFRRKSHALTHRFTTAILSDYTVPDLSTKVVFGASVSILAPWVCAALLLLHAGHTPPDLDLAFAFAADLTQRQLIAVRSVRPTKFPALFRLNAPSYDVVCVLPRATVPPLSEFTKNVAADIFHEFNKEFPHILKFYGVDNPPTKL